MELYEKLLEQLKNASFRDMLFTVFNFIEEDGFVREISSRDNINYSIDDFEFYSFKIEDTQKKALKARRKNQYIELLDFKYYIEKELQKGVPNVGIFLMNENGAMVAVKLKEYNIDKLF